MKGGGVPAGRGRIRERYDVMKWGIERTISSAIDPLLAAREAASYAHCAGVTREVAEMMVAGAIASAMMRAHNQLVAGMGAVANDG